MSTYGLFIGIQSVGVYIESFINLYVHPEFNIG
jgi:hypothetical protein